MHGRDRRTSKGGRSWAPITTQAKSQPGPRPCVWGSWRLLGRLRQTGDQGGLAEPARLELTSDGWLCMAQQGGSRQEKEPELSVVSTATETVQRRARDKAGDTGRATMGLRTVPVTKEDKARQRLPGHVFKVTP